MIKIKSLSKKFDQRGLAGVHDLSLSLDKGKILALLGPNGSGKSTFLKILANVIIPDSGDVFLQGKARLVDIQEPPQDMNVQQFLIGKVNLGMEEEKKIQLARDMADIFEFTFQLRQKLSQLSQGQRQKILLASELINHPEIILLDEPFNHLDPFTRREILSALFKYIRQRELTVIWVTHDRNEALRFADEIGLLNFGRIEQISVPEKIVFRPRNIFVAQFMGFENFIAVSKKTGNLWLTPWGLQELSFNSNFNEALLIIPHDAWEYDADQTIMFKVLDKKIQYHHWEMTLEWEEKRFNAGLPHSLKALLSEPKLSLRPRWSECFLVSL